MGKSVQLFDLGQVVATPGALLALEESGENPMVFVVRHVAGDWGDLDLEDQEANREAIRDGSRVFSSYRTSTGAKIYVITEANRSSTCVLLPEEY